MAMFTIDDISDNTKERFWAKVDQRGPDECWPWTGSKPVRGYGMFVLRTKVNVKATQVSLVLDDRPRPSEKHGALHTCDNPPCCNPKHLFWGTQVQNMSDANAKGRMRQPKGTDCVRSKLSEADVIAIRASTLGCAELGRQFGISPAHASSVQHRRIWKHI